MAKKKLEITPEIINDMQKYAPSQKGMICPFDPKTRCANWDNLDQYHKWDGEKYCTTSCFKGRKDGGKKLAKGLENARSVEEISKSSRFSLL